MYQAWLNQAIFSIEIDELFLVIFLKLFIRNLCAPFETDSRAIFLIQMIYLLQQLPKCKKGGIMRVKILVFSYDLQSQYSIFI